jgi:hypothetical protein
MLYDDDNLIYESSQTLKRINESKTYKKTLDQEIAEAKKRSDSGRHLFEEYDLETFKNKMNVDLLFFEQLLQKLEPEQTTQLEPVISKLYKTVREIYEFTNINPEIFGRFDVSIISESDEVIKQTLSKKIFTFLENKFYNLSHERQINKYKDQIIPTSEQLISEGTDHTKAVKFALKECISGELISNICFPFSIKSRIDYLMENEAYAEIFDQDKLKSLHESFINTSMNVAKVIAVCV